MSLKIIFAGTPEFAASSLDSLLTSSENQYQVIAVYTQPDRPAGRGKKYVESAVKKLAKKHAIPVFQPENFKTTESIETLHSLNADLMVVAAYGLILPKAVLDSPKLGCINIHASLLPRWRGAAPIQRAIQSGDNNTGITIMQMNEGLDTGDMLLKLETPILDTDTGGSLHDRLAEKGGSALLKALKLIEENKAVGIAQNNSLSTYAAKLSKDEAQINWHQSADAIARTVRAFNPWPVAYTLEADTRIRILHAVSVNTDNGHEVNPSPGTILKRDKAGLLIQCGKGQLLVSLIQLPGAKALAVADFINGNKSILKPETILISAPAATSDLH